MKKKKILIWGAGCLAANLVECFDKEKVKLLGFIDRDERKINNMFCDYKVWSASDAIKLEYDYIFISSVIYQKDIYQNALTQGIPAEKIIFALITTNQMGKIFGLLNDKGINYISYLKISSIEEELRNQKNRMREIEEVEKKRKRNHFLKEYYEKQAAEFISANFIEAENAPGRSVIFENRNMYFDYISERVKNKSGLFLEFGVYKGKTINYMAERINNKKIYGFDSFEGLPEDWHPGYEKSAYSLEGNIPKCKNNVYLIKGWFSETLPVFLEEHKDEKCVYIHIDCDLYSSTKYVLMTLKDRITKGTVICFDEFCGVIGWKKDEYAAFNEFIKETGFSYRYIACSYAEFIELTEAVAIEIV